MDEEVSSHTHTHTFICRYYVYVQINFGSLDKENIFFSFFRSLFQAKFINKFSKSKSIFNELIVLWYEAPNHIYIYVSFSLSNKRRRQRQHQKRRRRQRWQTISPMAYNCRIVDAKCVQDEWLWLRCDMQQILLALRRKTFQMLKFYVKHFI